MHILNFSSSDDVLRGSVQELDLGSDDEDDDMPALEPEGAKKESEAEQPTASGSGTSSS